MDGGWWGGKEISGLLYDDTLFLLFVSRSLSVLSLSAHTHPHIHTCMLVNTSDPALQCERGLLGVSGDHSL